MRDWQDKESYRYTENLSTEQWAWEFLRRNPRYREEWQAFISIWRALEACYGKAPNRDFCAWKQDDRAWVAASECTGSDCRIDGDKVLIECAMGARWGFYKFPPDPDDDDPVGAGRLQWREVAVEPTLLISHEDLVEPEPGQALVRFDLSLPLPAQLVSAKRQLQIEQRRRIKSGVIRAPRIQSHVELLKRLLRLLDALEADAQPPEIEQRIYGDSDGSVMDEKGTALRIRDQDYRQLLLLDSPKLNLI